MMKADHDDISSHRAVVDVASLRPKVLLSIRSAVLGYRDLCGQQKIAKQSEANAPNPNADELKITVLVTWNDQLDDEVLVRTHVCLLGKRATPPIKAQVRGHPRNNAAAKDSEWVRQRKSLEDMKPDDVNEVILADDDGHLYEGLSSNFFALVDGKLVTAGDGILLGSVREAALRVAHRHGIPVVLEPPKIDTINTWEGAFVSSTSRLFLPLDELSVPDENIKKTFERTELVKNLDKWVWEEVRTHSELLDID